MTVNAGIVPADERLGGAARDPIAASTFVGSLSRLGSRLAILAVGWLVLIRTDGIGRSVLIAAAIAVGYALARMTTSGWVVKTGPRRVAAGADLCSTALLVGFALIPGAPSWSAVLVVVFGAARGLAEQAHASITSGLPGSASAGGGKLSLLALPLIGGVGAGVMAGWLGAVAVVWIAALTFAVTAAMVGWQAPGLAGVDGAALPAEAVTQELRMYRPERLRRVGLNDAGIAAAIDAAGIAGALALVVLWVHDVAANPATLGLIGGAFVIGALAVGCAPAIAQPGPVVAAAAAIGYGLGSVPLSQGQHLTGQIWALAAAALIAGAVFVARTPVREIMVDYLGRPVERVIPVHTAASIGYMTLPLAAFIGAIVAIRMPTTGGLLVAGLVYLVAIAAPLVGRPATPGEVDPIEQASPLRLRLEGVATWVAVTLVYADGAWTVEVERRAGDGEGGHEVRATDALQAIEILDLPGVRAEIEAAIAADQARAEREAERLRQELGGLGEKLTAINEMVEWSELWRAGK